MTPPWSRRLLAVVTALALLGLATPATAAPAPTAAVARALPGSNLTIDGDDKVVGRGTPASCTFTALAKAVRSGGNVSFDCGPDPVTIKIDRTLFTCNTHNCAHVWQGGVPLTNMTLDGGGLITLDGQDERGIYYANSCEDSFGWLDSRCDLSETLRVHFLNLTFKDGNATSGFESKDSVGGGGGGGAIAMRGNRLRVDNVLFTSNRCMRYHSDAGGGAIRVVGMQRTAIIKNSDFWHNWCANGGAVSSLHAPLIIKYSVIAENKATGSGASSGQGGNGGGVYFDGTDQKVEVIGSKIKRNRAYEGGSGVFYVSNNRAGTLAITDSIITDNYGESFWTSPYHDLFYLGKTLAISGSTVD